MPNDRHEFGRNQMPQRLCGVNEIRPYVMFHIRSIYMRGRVHNPNLSKAEFVRRDSPTDSNEKVCTKYGGAESNSRSFSFKYRTRVGVMNVQQNCG